MVVDADTVLRAVCVASLTLSSLQQTELMSKSTQIITNNLFGMGKKPVNFCSCEHFSKALILYL
jgi:hypothetical protein